MSGFESNWAVTDDKVRNHYGPRGLNEEFGGQVSTSDHDKVLYVDVDFSDFPIEAGGALSTFVPAGAEMTSLKLRTKKTWVGINPMEVFITDVDGTNPVLLGDSALIVGLAGEGVEAFQNGIVTTGIIPKDGYINVVVTGTATAGEGTIELRYTDKRSPVLPE